MNDQEYLQEQLDSLEERVSKIESYLEEKHQVHTTTKAVSKPAPPTVFEKQIFEKQKIKTPTGPSASDALVNWLKTDWLMKLGAFLLLLALGWFVSYAFINNWIGPVGRIAIGIVVGVAIMTVGHLAVPKRRAPGLVLVVLGGIMILCTVFAARILYDFFNPALALAMMSVVVVGMAIISIVHNAKSVAILALLGGAIVPLLVHSPTPDYLALLSYIFVLSLGVIAVAALRGWREMIPLAMIITGLYSLSVFHSLQPQYLVWIFMALFFGLFLASNIAAILRSKSAQSVDLATTAMNGLLLLYWIYEFVPRESASLVLSGLVLLLVGISYVLSQVEPLKHTLYLHSGLAVLFLGAATAFELKGEMLTIAFAIEAFVISALATYVIKDAKYSLVLSLVQVIPFVMAILAMRDGSWESGPLFSKAFFAVLITIVSLIGTSVILKTEKSDDNENAICLSLRVLAGLLGIAFIWLTAHNIFTSDNTARGVALVIYTLAGVGTLFYGSYARIKEYRVMGGILLAGVVLRLLFVEVWQMSLAGKIVTFVAIGVLLVLTAFFQKHISKPE